MSHHEVLALIPARGGSKRVPRKNLRMIGGKPLVAHSIEQSLAASSIARTVVSTDDPEIAEVAQRYGAEVPFLRPPEISGDAATDLEAFEHALGWLLDHEGYVPDICVHLRPTYPLRKVEDINRMVAVLIDTPGLDSVRSVTPAAETPFKMWFRDDTGVLAPVMGNSVPEAWNLPRQQLPAVFTQNASIDVVWTRVIAQRRSMTGSVIYGYLMDSNFDIDTEGDLRIAERRLSAYKPGP
jgi:CMP-N-acetylneuraminic acid synthetase